MMTRKYAPNLTHEEASRRGKLSGIARQKKKSMRDAAKALLSMKAVNVLGTDDAVKFAAYIRPETTVNEAIVMVQAVKAIQLMDTQAAVFVRDTAGEKPTDNVNLDGKISYTNLLKKAVGEDM